MTSHPISAATVAISDGEFRVKEQFIYKLRMQIDDLPAQSSLSFDSFSLSLGCDCSEFTDLNWTSLTRRNIVHQGQYPIHKVECRGKNVIHKFTNIYIKKQDCIPG
jgi:hypothetical protein